MVHTYNGRLFTLKIEGNPAIFNNSDEPCGHNARGDKLDTEEQTPHDSTSMTYLKHSDL